jgi:SpoVK/Ycf46/Vps4 family AAA+-type ATPase
MLSEVDVGLHQAYPFSALPGSMDGRIRRVLNSFLQFLERDDSDSVIIAATNFVDMLDEALFRRFDDVVEYELPDRALVRRLVENRLTCFDLTGVKWEEVDVSARGLSHAEVVRACEDAACGAVLSGERVVTSESLTVALRCRSGMRPFQRRKQQQDERSAPPEDSE